MTTLLLLCTRGVFRRTEEASAGSTEKYDVYSCAYGEKYTSLGSAGLVRADGGAEALIVGGMGNCCIVAGGYWILPGYWCILLIGTSW